MNKNHGTTSQVTGNYVEFQAAVLRALPRDIDLDTVIGWTKNGESLARILREALVPKAGNNRLTVDYRQTLEQMIAAGRYDWTNSDITAKRFPIVGEGSAEYEWKLFHFGRDISSEDAVKAIEADDSTSPWGSAKIEHLLSFGARYPEEQLKYPIIGLGSVTEVDDARHVPYLRKGDSERHLDLAWWHDDWRGRYRFLAVRKLSSAA